MTICPNCNAEHTSGPRCAGCDYAFIFQHAEDGIDDRSWLALLEHVSPGGGEWFTENRLFALYAERRVTTTRRIGRRAWLGFSLMALGFGLWVRSLRGYSGLMMAIGFMLALCGVALVVGGILTERHLPERAPLKTWLEKWQLAHPELRWLREPGLDGSRAGLLEHASLRPARLVIVERDLLVDWLVENGVDRELDLLVLSERGYPQKSQELARQALRELPELEVLVLHDASLSGTEMQRRVSSSKLLQLGARPLRDIGLFPADVTRVASVCQMLPEALVYAPLDMLPREAVMDGLRGVARGELLLVDGIGAG